MDENEYRNAYQGLNETRCPFEKSILTLNCRCRYQHKFNLAEREGIRCDQPESQQNCAVFLNECRKQARFALRLTEIVGNLLPHSKEAQVQKGALLGLAPELPNRTYTQIPDIYALIEKAVEASNGNIQQYPFEQLIPFITRHPPLPRRRRRNKPE